MAQDQAFARSHQAWTMIETGPLAEGVGIVAAASAECGNPECDTGCPSVVIAFGALHKSYSLRLDPDVADALADDIKAQAQRQREHLKGKAN